MRFYLTDEHQAMLHVVNNPASYGAETTKEMNSKLIQELYRLWEFERTSKDAVADIKCAINRINGYKEQA